MQEPKLICSVCGRKINPKTETWEADELHGILCEFCLDDLVYGEEDDFEEEEYFEEE